MSRPRSAGRDGRSNLGTAAIIAAAAAFIAAMTAPPHPLRNVTALFRAEWQETGAGSGPAKGEYRAPARPEAVTRPYANGIRGMKMAAGPRRDPFTSRGSVPTSAADGSEGVAAVVRARITLSYAGQETEIGPLHLPHRWGHVYFFLDWLASTGCVVLWDETHKAGAIRYPGSSSFLVFAAGCREMLEVTSPNPVLFDKAWVALTGGGLEVPSDASVRYHRVPCEPLAVGGEPMLPIRGIGGFLGLDERKDIVDRGTDADGTLDILVKLRCPPEELLAGKAKWRTWRIPRHLRDRLM